MPAPDTTPRPVPPPFRVVSGRLEAPSVTATGYRGQKRDALQPVVIERTWREPGGFAILVFAVFWNVFIGGFIAASAMSADFPVLAHVCFAPFVLVGVAVLYLGLAERLNRTRWVVSPRAITVIHRPLPFRGARVSVDRVRAIVVVLTTYLDDAGKREMFAVVARTDRNEVELWPPQHGDATAPRFLARVLAEQLGVPDETSDRRS